MTVAGKLSFLLPAGGIRQTVARFPLSVVCSLVVFILTIAGVHQIIDMDDETLLRTVGICIAGYFWLGAGQVVAESRSWNRVKYYALVLPPLAALGAFVFLSEQWGLHFTFLVPFLLLFVMVAPFLNRARDDDSAFWQYNRTVWVGVALAILMSVILGAGVSAALASIKFLFGVKVSEKVFSDVWLFCSTVFAPFYALSWIPRKDAIHSSAITVPPGLPFLLNWILAPLVCVYFVILYAYMAKILLQGSLPQGQLAVIMTGFGGVGVVTTMMAWPLRDGGTKLLTLVHRYFFPVLLLPALVMALAVWTRIDAYGVTEQRYMLVLAAAWFIVLAGLSLFRKEGWPLKLSPAVLAVLFLLGSFGPWGGVGVSGHSQFARLQALMTKYNITAGDATEKDIPLEDRKTISSIVDYLASTERRELLRAWADSDEAIKNFRGTKTFLEALGIAYTGSWESNNSQYYSYTDASEGRPLLIDGFKYKLYFNLYTSGPQVVTCDVCAGDPKPAFTVGYSDGTITAGVTGHENIAFDLRPEIEKRRTSGDAGAFVVDAQAPGIRGRAIVRSASVSYNTDKPHYGGVSFELLLDF